MSFVVLIVVENQQGRPSAHLCSRSPPIRHLHVAYHDLFTTHRRKKQKMHGFMQTQAQMRVGRERRKAERRLGKPSSAMTSARAHVDLGLVSALDPTWLRPPLHSFLCTFWGIMSGSYKENKEAFVSDGTGSSLAHINLVSSVAVVSHLRFLASAPYPELIHSSRSRFMSSCSNAYHR